MKSFIFTGILKKSNGNGTLFVDADDDVSIPDDNLIIYGHNMKNGNMFHDILKYEDEDYYKGHKYIQFDTIYGDGKYEVIAAFRTEIYDKNYTGFKYYSFRQELKKSLMILFRDVKI